MKYKIGDIVKIKATGEKVRIEDFMNIYGFKDGVLVKKEDRNYIIPLESEIKPYRPSRTGKYRNEKGQFTHREECICSWCDTWFYDIGKHLMECRMRKSSQRNYQKIEKLDYRPMEYVESQRLADKLNEIIDRLNNL